MTIEDLEVNPMSNGNELMHIGIARRSGRYPWGSGEDPYQRSLGFRSFQEDMKKKGLSEKQILEVQIGRAHV